MQPNQNDNFFQVYPYKKMKGTLEVIWSHAYTSEMRKLRLR